MNKKIDQWWWEEAEHPSTATDNIVRTMSIRDEPIEEPTPGPLPVPLPGPGESLLLFENLGTIGMSPIITEQNIDQTIVDSFSSLQRFKTADEWIILMKHAHICRIIYPWINKSETLLFSSSNSTTMNEDYVATRFNQLHFNLLRAYARAYENDFNSAKILLDQIANKWITEADEYRQPYFLRHLYTTSLCTKDWDNAMLYLDQLWLLIKFMDPNKRHAYGAWDEWTCCLIVTWIFMKYWKEFDQTVRKNYLLQSQPFRSQHKTTILKYLDINFLSEIIDQSYYNKARELNPNLPIIEYKEKSQCLATTINA